MDSQKDPEGQTFTLPQDPQINSRLMRLPFEIRQKILRNLLKNSSSIRPQAAELLEHDIYNVYRFSAGPPSSSWEASVRASFDRVEEKVQLSSHVLGVCQQLHEEGAVVLYGENTLEVHEIAYSYGPYVLVLNAICKARQHHYPLSERLQNNDRSQGPDMLSVAGWRVAEKASEDRSSECKSLADAYPMIEKFANVHLHLQITDQFDLFDWCSFFDLFTRNKKISITVKLKDNAIEVPTDWFKSFRGLRCRAIAFPGVESRNAESLAELKCAITSDQAAPDVFSLYHETNVFGYEVLHGEWFGWSSDEYYRHTSPLLDEYDAKVTELGQAMLDHDLAEMQRLKVQLLRTGAPCVEKWPNGSDASASGTLRKRMGQRPCIGARKDQCAGGRISEYSTGFVSCFVIAGEDSGWTTIVEEDARKR